MKKFRNVLSLSLIVVFFLASAMLSSAIGGDDGSSRIVVKPAGEGASYESHVILNTSRGGPEGSGVSYTVNSDYQNALNRVVPAGNQDDIPGYIAGLSGNDLQEFADRLYKEIRSEGIPAYGTAGASQGEADLGGRLRDTFWSDRQLPQPVKFTVRSCSTRHMMMRQSM